uniref:Beta-galactosidase n=1 Tax=Cyclophora tenuis TaxID=216820 RepID=A0A7S1GP28_CYCTE|mmetsp:Transcript_3569/g.6082  ORF Transcript_3569/g.6082 Transcript_3569/m.6082 type:complete len:164 (+) Transcript_3569:14-505(+)
MTIKALITLALIGGAQGFPSWLKCFVDLDETENIMGSQVKTFDDAPHKVYIEVQEEGSDEWHEHYSFTSGKETTLQLRLKVPDDLKGEVQWAAETSVGGSFLKPTLCDGRRSFSRNYDSPVSVKLNGEADSVTIWAGWATGHSPVSMTEKLILSAAAEGESEL